MNIYSDEFAGSISRRPHVYAVAFFWHQIANILYYGVHYEQAVPQVFEYIKSRLPKCFDFHESCIRQIAIRFGDHINDYEDHPPDPDWESKERSAYIEMYFYNQRSRYPYNLYEARLSFAWVIHMINVQQYVLHLVNGGTASCPFWRSRENRQIIGQQHYDHCQHFFQREAKNEMCRKRSMNLAEFLAHFQNEDWDASYLHREFLKRFDVHYEEEMQRRGHPDACKIELLEEYSDLVELTPLAGSNLPLSPPLIYGTADEEQPHPHDEQICN